MTNVHLDLIEDEKGDLVDIDYYHHHCAGNLADWPSPQFPDYAVYCKGCDGLIYDPTKEIKHC